MNMLDRPVPFFLHGLPGMLLACLALLAPLFGQETDDSNEQKIVDRFQVLLEKSPRRGTAFDRVYGFYADRGQIEAFCRENLEKSPDSPAVRILDALIRDRQGRHVEALDSLKKAVELDDKAFWAFMYLGEILFRQGRLGEAAENLEAALKRMLSHETEADNGSRAGSKELLFVLQTLGRIYQRLADPDQADRIADLLEKSFSGDSEILLQAAETLEEENRFEEALFRYRRVEELARNDETVKFHARFAIGNLLAKLHRSDEALECFDTLLDHLSPDSWQAGLLRDRIERLFLQDRNASDLVAYYRKRQEKTSGDAENLRRLALALRRLSRDDEALEILQSGLETLPSNISLRSTLAETLTGAKRFSEAAVQYAEIDRLAPNDPDNLARWARAVLDDTGLDAEARKNRAAEILRRSLSGAENDPAKIAAVAEQMNRAGLTEDAEKLFRRAVELQPGDPGRRESLAHFYRQHNRRDDAVATLRLALSEDRAASETFRLAEVFRSFGYSEEAGEMYRDTVRKDPENFEYRMRYADWLLDGLSERQKYSKAERELHVAETIAEPLSEQYRRVLAQQADCLLASNRLATEIANLRPRLAGAPSTAGYWKLAVFLFTSGQSEATVEALEQALLTGSTSPAFLESVADLFGKAGRPDRAATIYETLLQIDPTRRIEHLKRLAGIHRELGRIGEAIETARQLVATGAGNSANFRFYADLLVADGRIEEAIDVLRRSLRFDGSDKATLSALGNLLLETGRTDEGFETLWRLFEKADNLPDKLAAVSQMAVHYQRAGRFEELLNRLRRFSSENGLRRESAYFSAQAYMTVSNPKEARRILETILTESDRPDGDEQRLLLARLSSLAESLDDLPAAIRYQETLCRLNDDVGENERLMLLYRKHGDDEAAAGVLFDRILARGNLRERLSAVDDLLARADYATARRIATRLDEQHPDHWEILYRKLMTEFWLDAPDAAEQTSQRILRLDISWNDMSLAKRHEMGAANAVVVEPPKNSDDKMSRSPHPFWRFGMQHLSFHPGASFLNRTQTDWAHANIEQFETIFRDRLKLYGAGGSFGNAPANPPRPQFMPDDFGNARFGVLTWRLRIALRRGVSTFRTVLDELRNSLPENDTVRLEERLRLESFLEQSRLIVEAYRDAFTEPADIFLYGFGTGGRKEELLRAADELRGRLQCELAFRGDTNWYFFAYNRLLHEIFLGDITALPDKVDIPDRYRKLSWHSEILDRFSKKELEEGERAVADRVESIRCHNGNLLDNAKAVEFLFRFWEHNARQVAEGKIADLTGGGITAFPAFTLALRKIGFSDRIPEAEKILQRICRAISPVEAATLKVDIEMFAEPFEEEIGDEQHPFAALLYGSREHPFFSIAFHPVDSSKPRERNVSEEILQAMKWLENRPDKAALDQRYEILSKNLDTVVDAVLEQGDAAPEFGQMISRHLFFQTPRLLEMLKPVPADASRQKILTVTPEYLSRIDLAEKEIYRCLDCYFRIMNRLESVRHEPDPLQKTETIPPLQEFLPFFERWQGNRLPPSATTASEQPPLIVYVSYSFLETADHFVRSGRLQKGTPPSGADRLERLKRYLADKRDHGTPVERELTARFGRWVDDTFRMTRRTPKSAREYRMELEAEKNEAARRGEPFPASKRLLLAVYHRWDGNPAKAAEYLDSVPFTLVADLRLREQLVLKLFREKRDDEFLKKRTETAVDRLLGYQLRENELMTLYETLELLGEREKAHKVLDRLLYVATNLNAQYKLLDIINRNENAGEADKAVRFAWRVLTSPSIQAALLGRTSFAPEARNLALQILEKAGRLHEYVEYVEKRWADAPGTPETALSLADLYFRQDRQDEAMEMVGEIEKMVTTRKMTSQDYDNLLRRGGLRQRIANLKQRTETDEAAHRLKVLEATPEKLLENLPVQVLVYEKSHLVPDFIEALKKNRPEVLLPAMAGVMRHVENWLDNFYSREATRGLLEYLWKMDGVDEKRKQELRLALLESFSCKTGREECLPMFQEMVFDLLETEAEAKIFLPTHVDPDRIFSIGVTYLDLAEKLGKLYENSRRLLDRLESVDDPSPALVALAAASEVRRQNDGNAFELVQKLLKRKDADSLPENLRLFLAQELVGSAHPGSVALAVEWYRKERDRKPGNPMIDSAVRNALEKLTRDPH